MQNRYAGDVGDFVKLAFLRALSPGFRLGVACWLYPDEAHNADGKHITYLTRSDEWRYLDPDLFDALRQIVETGQRSVASLEQTGLLLDATFASDPIPTETSDRRAARQKWFQSVTQKVDQAELVFIDPDNGLEPDGYSHGSTKAGKSITLAELKALARPGRCLIVYHHQTRRKGGHHAEIEHWGARLRQIGFHTVDALRASRGSARVFFVLDAPGVIRYRAERFAQRWNGHVSWHADAGIKTGPTLVPIKIEGVVEGVPTEQELRERWPHLNWQPIQEDLWGEIEPGSYLPKGYLPRLRRSMANSISRAQARQADRPSPVPVTITTDECMELLRRQGYRCALTRMQFWLQDVKHSFSPRIPTLDRIDHNGPYSAENVRVVLLGVNALRGTGSDEEMYEVATQLLVHRPQK